MSASIIECSVCGEEIEVHDCYCPNDVIEETGWEIDEDGYWICPKCGKESL